MSVDSFTILLILTFVSFEDRRQPGLTCQVTNDLVTINTTAGRSVDLDDLSTSGNKTYSPNRFITLDITTLNQPQQVNITIEDKWGTSNKCTLLLYTKGKIKSVRLC